MVGPVLLVGVGGAGGATLRVMRQSLLRQLKQAGWDKDTLPAGWQMLWIDSLANQEEYSAGESMLPDESYVGLVDSGMDYRGLLESLENSIPLHHRQKVLAGWVPPSVPISVSGGAGQTRAIGRVISAAQLSRLKGALEESNARLSGVSVHAELAEVAGLFGQLDYGLARGPLCIVISSIVGGTGSGIFLDVIEVLKNVNPGFQRPDSIITVLYTPDVFASVAYSNGQGAPNALATIMEVTAGALAPGISEPTASLMNAHSLRAQSDHGFGAKCNFLVGASNKNVTLGSQEEIFKAVGDSLSAIVTDDTVQQIFRIFMLTKVFPLSGHPQVVEDKSLLSESSDLQQAMPFSALGMGRVSLGTDRLHDYISQILSRDIAAQLLWPDEDNAANNDGVMKTREERINERVSQTWESFLIQSGLNERDSSDDISGQLVDASQLEMRVQQWASEGLSRARQGVGDGGLAPTDWAQRLQTYFDNHLATIKAQEAANRYELAQNWTETLSEKVTAVIAQSMIRNGLAVTVRLVDRLIDEMMFVKDELRGEAESNQNRQLKMPKLLQQTLNVGANRLELNDDAIDKAVSVIRSGAQLDIDADRLLLGSALTEDLIDGFLRPISSALQFSRARLSESVNSSRLPDGRPNTWPVMPEYDNPVPTQLLPGNTECVVIEPNTYQSVLEAEAQACLPDPQDRSAWRMVIRERAALGQEFDTGLAKGTSILHNTIGWVPRDKQATRARASGVKAEFDFPRTVADIQTAVEAWLSNVELSVGLGRFLNQGLVEYVDSGTPEQQIARQTRLISAFTSAIAISEPFVTINPAVKSVLHPRANEKVLSIVSTIPFVEGHPLHDQLKNALIEGGLWDDTQSPSWFGTAKVDKIGIFTMLGIPMMPMVFDNIMKPIAHSWSSNKENPAKRSSFWASRRTRPFIESIPAGQGQITAILRGWFVSALLNQRVQSDEGASGWKVSVWDPGSSTYIDFPFPLLSSRPVSRSELPAAILASLAIAMVQVNETSSLAPLLPYHRLIELGEISRFRSIINTWLVDGRVDGADAPVPVEAISGPVHGTQEDRRRAVTDTLTRTRDMYQEIFEKMSLEQDPYTVSDLWEIRGLFLDVLDELLKAVEGSIDLEI